MIEQRERVSDRPETTWLFRNLGHGMTELRRQSFHDSHSQMSTPNREVISGRFLSRSSLWSKIQVTAFDESRDEAENRQAVTNPVRLQAGPHSNRIRQPEAIRSVVPMR